MWRRAATNEASCKGDGLFTRRWSGDERSESQRRRPVHEALERRVKLSQLVASLLSTSHLPSGLLLNSFDTRLASVETRTSSNIMFVATSMAGRSERAEAMEAEGGRERMRLAMELARAFREEWFEEGVGGRLPDATTLEETGLPGEEPRLDEERLVLFFFLTSSASFWRCVREYGGWEGGGE